MHRTVMILAAGMLAALPAAAQIASRPAKANLQHHLACYTDGVYLEQTDSGGYVASMRLSLEEKGMQTTSVPDFTPQFFANEVVHASIVVSYNLMFDGRGYLTDGPLPQRIEVNGPGFVGQIPAPADAFRLRLEVAGQPSPVLTYADPAPNQLEGVYALPALAGANAQATPLEPEYMNALVHGIEAGGAIIVTLKDGQEVARTPVPNADLPAQSARMLEWLKVALPLITQGNCPA